MSRRNIFTCPTAVANPKRVVSGGGRIAVESAAARESARAIESVGACIPIPRESEMLGDDSESVTAGLLAWAMLSMEASTSLSGAGTVSVCA